MVGGGGGVGAVFRAGGFGAAAAASVASVVQAARAGTLAAAAFMMVPAGSAAVAEAMAAAVALVAAMVATAATGIGAGGLGAGGAAFVRAGGSLTLIDPVFTGTISAVGGADGAATRLLPGSGKGYFSAVASISKVSSGNLITLSGADFLGGKTFNADAQGRIDQKRPWYIDPCWRQLLRWRNDD